jgi:hypothetical protein
MKIETQPSEIDRFFSCVMMNIDKGPPILYQKTKVAPLK